MNRVVGTVSAVALGFLARFGEDCGSRLAEIAKEIGLSIEEVDADKFDGALLRIAGLPRGTVVLNKNVREHGRKLFTLATRLVTICFLINKSRQVRVAGMTSGNGQSGCLFQSFRQIASQPKY